jgi:hypothetical protein
MGAVTVAIGPRPAAGAPAVRYWIETFTRPDDRPNITRMGNILALWTLTAELGSAVSRQGRTLIFWQSVGMPGGRERAQKHQGQVFHSDNRRMRPTAQGALARAYLDFIERMFAAITEREGAKLEDVVAEVQRRNAQGYLPLMMTNSHVMTHVLRPGGEWFRYFAGGADDLAAALGANGLLLYLGYYHPLPMDVREAAHRAGAKVVWMAVPRPDQKMDHAAAGDTFIDQHWNMGDASVAVPDYDVKILPASGLAQLFLYEWLGRGAGRQAPARPVRNLKPERSNSRIEPRW